MWLFCGHQALEVNFKYLFNCTDLRNFYKKAFSKKSLTNTFLYRASALKVASISTIIKTKCYLGVASLNYIKFLQRIYPIFHAAVRL